MPSIQVEPPFKVVMTPVEAKTFDVTVSAPNPLIQVFSEGPQGPVGEQGEQGEQGIQGEQGEQGIQGEKGDTGEQGEQGEQGIQGEQGEQGIEGEKGDTGDTGEQGPQGDTGDTGIVISPTEPDDTDVLWADTSEVGDAVVPVGGTTGQSLVKASDGDYDSEWATLDIPAVPAGSADDLVALDGAGAFKASVPRSVLEANGLLTIQQWKSGEYYGLPFVATTATAPGAGALTCYPVVVSNTVTVDEITAEVVTAGATSVLRAGIYAHDNTTRLPGELIVDAGTAAASSPGLKSIAISETLTPGIYWLAVVRQGADSVAFRTTATTGGFIPWLSPGPALISGGTRNAYPRANAAVTGALPDPFGSVIYSSFTPVVQLKVA